MTSETKKLTNGDIVATAKSYVKYMRGEESIKGEFAATINRILRENNPDAHILVMASALWDAKIGDEEGKNRLRDYRKELKRQAIKHVQLDQFPTVHRKENQFTIEWKTESKEDGFKKELLKANQEVMKNPSRGALVAYMELAAQYRAHLNEDFAQSVDDVLVTNALAEEEILTLLPEDAQADILPTIESAPANSVAA